MLLFVIVPILIDIYFTESLIFRCVGYLYFILEIWIYYEFKCKIKHAFLRRDFILSMCF